MEDMGGQEQQLGGAAPSRRAGDLCAAYISGQEQRQEPPLDMPSLAAVAADHVVLRWHAQVLEALHVLPGSSSLFISGLFSYGVASPILYEVGCTGQLLQHF